MRHRRRGSLSLPLIPLFSLFPLLYLFSLWTPPPALAAPAGPAGTVGARTQSSRLDSLPDWTAEGDQENAEFGFSVASAGDVNGDGYEDILVGTPKGVPGSHRGRVCLFLGSSSGPSPTPAWTAQGGRATAEFGYAVAAAGDVDGDGYGDVIIGAPGEGWPSAYVYRGSPFGLSHSPWVVEALQTLCYFGASVAGAGDVNGDGYADVLVGAPGWDGAVPGEGSAFLYTGSANGLSTTPGWTGGYRCGSTGFGTSVSTAGDVNADGFDDIIVGAPGFTGRAYVYLGSPSGPGLVQAWMGDPGQNGARFGSAVSNAGDVNGDGYGDVLVAAYRWDGGEYDEGAVFLYAGSATGVSPDPAWSAEGNQILAQFGYSVSTAGDVNRDGYAEVIIGAWFFDQDEVDEGRAYVYGGSESGLSADPIWTAEGDQNGALLGRSVSTAGDVNRDGFADVIVGAPRYTHDETNEGRASVYFGSGPSSGILQGDAGPLAGLSVLGAAPNPFGRRTSITYALPFAARVRIDVHDATGRRVATLLDGEQGAGRQEVLWDGRGAEGCLAPAGVYLARLRCNGILHSIRLVRVP